MPKRIVPLTDLKILKSKPRSANYSLFDGHGLFILITPSGGKLWRYKYTYEGKSRLLALGSYPEISLQSARALREDARQLLAKGIDPSAFRKAQKQAKTTEGETFEVMAREWHDKFRSQWTEAYGAKILRRLEHDVFPWIGKEPIRQLGAQDIFKILTIAASRGVIDSAHRLRGTCGMVFRYAVATGRADRDPTHDLIGALPPAQVKHRAAIIDPEQAAGLLRAIDGYQGSYIVQCALKLAPLTFLRPGELRQGEWEEISFKESLWKIPPEKMKMRESHIVPLATQSIAILKELYRLTGGGRYLFPSARSADRPMSDNAVLAALRRMGYDKEEMSGHGFRAMARTILDEQLHVRIDYIEHQLAHAVKDPNGRAYNRTAHLEERRKMMQRWADYLDEIKSAGKVYQSKASEKLFK